MVDRFKYTCYVGDYGDVIFSDVSDSISLTISIGEVVVLNEIYHPDASRKVVVSGIGDILRYYFELDKTDLFLQKSVNRSITVDVRYEIGAIVRFVTQVVYYSSVLIDPDNLYDRFLTRYRQKKTNSLRQELLSIYDFRAKTIELGVAYLHDGVEQYHRSHYANILQCSTYNISMWSIPDWLDGEIGYSIDPLDIIYYDVYALDAAGLVVDQIRYKNDKRLFPHEVKLAYYNCFGVLETIACTGLTKSNTELNGSYIQSKDSYSKVHTDPVTTHRLFTGYLDAVEVECMQDLIRSERVWIYQDPHRLTPITITDVDLESNNRGDLPTGYAISYRLSDNRLVFHQDGVTPTRSFDKTFDYTFG